jgi:kynureninase
VFSRDDAAALDAADPLAPWRDEFVIPDDELVYLDGNSLGRPARRTVDAIQHAVDEWATGLIGSWDAGWMDLPFEAGAAIAPLLGVDGDEVVVHDSVSVNLHQLVHAALTLHPGRPSVAIDPSDFPSDVYIVESVAEQRGVTVRTDVDDLDEVGVVVRSLVDYRTGEVADLASETARAREAGALVIWDLCHAVGVLELDLHAAGVAFAVGCTYKFLGAGPGGPGFSYVSRELVAQLHQPLHGWFGQHDQFAMPSTYTPRPDIGRLLIGTPGIVGIAAAKAGAEVVAEAGIAAVHAKVVALTRLALDLAAQWGLESPTPQDDDRRGGHVSIRHPQARELTAALAERRILVDFREPDLVRLGCSPLTTRFTDVHDGVAALAALAGRLS